MLLVGPAGVGKSSFIIKAIRNSFSTQYQATLGIDLYKSSYIENGSQLKLNIWDIGGQQSFQSLTTTQNNKSNVIIFFYDLTINDSYEQLKAFHAKVKGVIDSNSKLFVLGMKSDLEENRGVTAMTMEGFANEINAVFLGEVSAANNSQDDLMKILKIAANNFLQK